MGGLSGFLERTLQGRAPREHGLVALISGVTANRVGSFKVYRNAFPGRCHPDIIALSFDTAEMSALSALAPSAAKVCFEPNFPNCWSAANVILRVMTCGSAAPKRTSVTSATTELSLVRRKVDVDVVAVGVAQMELNKPDRV